MNFNLAAERNNDDFEKKGYFLYEVGEVVVQLIIRDTVVVGNVRTIYIIGKGEHSRESRGLFRYNGLLS